MKKGFTLIEVMATICIMVLFFAALNLSVSYVTKLQEPSLDEFSDNLIKNINNARFYCINNDSRGEIQQIKEDNKTVIRFKSKKLELIRLYVPKNISIDIPYTNNFKQEMTIDKYGSITPVRDIVIKNKEKERRIKVNFYSRGIYEK